MTSMPNIRDQFSTSGVREGRDPGVLEIGPVGSGPGPGPGTSETSLGISKLLSVEGHAGAEEVRRTKSTLDR